METITHETTPIIINDAVVEFWADRYMADRLIDCGLPFEVYMQNLINRYPPLPWFDLVTPFEGEHMPLLPVQKAVAEFLYQDELTDEELARESDNETLHVLQAQLDRDAGVVYRNGAYTEVLHHHTRFKHSRRSHFKPGVLS